MQKERNYTILDQFCLNVDQAIRTLCGQPKSTGRPYPAKQNESGSLTREQKKQAAALMRVNHTGEVCAQALYHAQALVSSDPKIKEKMRQAVIEEGDHLNWCKTRLLELESHVSYFNFFWYSGSFLMGVIAGLAGDKWSLGFVAETETQVVAHLGEHLILLPEKDFRSYSILQQMRGDEAHHHDDAIKAGAVSLPRRIKKIMRGLSKIMVKTAYYI